MSLVVKSPAGITMMLRELLEFQITAAALCDLEVTFHSVCHRAALEKWQLEEKDVLCPMWQSRQI